jgi:HEAT repeat protein
VELSPDQLTAFVAAIDHPDESCQREELTRLGVNPGNVRVRQLLPLLAHPSRDVREFVARRLAERELRGEAYPEVEAALRDESALVRVLAAAALWAAPKLRCRLIEEEFVAVCLTALSAPEVAARFNAARCLVHRGRASRSVLPRLLALAEDPDPYVRAQALRATFWVGASSEEAEPVLGRLEGDPSPFVRSYVVTARERLRVGEADAAEPRATPDRGD